MKARACTSYFMYTICFKLQKNQHVGRATASLLAERTVIYYFWGLGKVLEVHTTCKVKQKATIFCAVHTHT